jgi:hypothetical protein
MRKTTFKTRWLFALVLPVVAWGLTACSDDDDCYSAVDNQAPVITLASDRIQTEANRAFTIEANIKDADGIKSIHLKNEGMFLDKTINLLEIKDELLKEYDLKYTYQRSFTKDWVESDSYPVVITVEDVVGNKQTATVTVTADGDFTNPVFAVAPSKELTVLVQNPKLKLSCTVTDNKRVDYVQVVCQQLNINDRISADGKSEFLMKQVYELPAVKTAYDMTITAYDQQGNSVSTTCTINVDEMPDFAKMYLADVDNVADLSSDVYGVPMLIDHTGEYEYTARYYNQKAGTKVRFIPQMTDFEPICFGLDPEDNSLLANSVDAEGITLNEVAYYEIKLNIVTGAYSVKTYTPDTQAMTLNGTTFRDFGDGSGEQPEQICLAGEGMPGVGGWKTNQNDGAYILSQDEKNPYLLYGYLDLEKGGPQIQFTISQTHWWGWWPEPFWRFDGSDYNEKNTLNGGDNMKKMEIPATGRYRFEFDYHLLRSRIIPVK